MGFTEDEKCIIAECINEGGRVWENKKLDDIKTKIKDYYRHKHHECCCYCHRNLHGEFSMVIDIEHILPKSLFPKFMFDLENLNIACKRCNMNIKRDNTDFVVDINTIKSNYRQSHQYYFIHPNFDVYHDHMSYECHIKNHIKLIKYTHLSDKGKYTYEYFKLRNLEIDTLDRAQGIENDGVVEIASTISDSEKVQLQALITKI